MFLNRLILGDNFEILKGMESDTVDLIYLDPPFFSNRNYEVIFNIENLCYPCLMALQRILKY